MNADTEYCRNLVERHDRDRYILSMAADAAARPALWALYAFNHEIAKTREVTRENHAAQIRFAWWREALNGFYAGKDMPAHDVARALGAAIREYALPQDSFLRLIEARVHDVNITSLESIAAYSEATNTPLLSLSAKILGVEDATLDHLGAAWGLTGIIRALPFYAQQNRCVLPMPMLHDIGLMPEQFHHLSPSPALAQAVKTLADTARNHLEQADARDDFLKMQKRMNAFYLRRIEKAGYNPFDARVHGIVPFLGLRLLF